MRRILVESARRKKRAKHGGDRQRVDLDDQDVLVRPPPDAIVAPDQALLRLAEEKPEAAQIRRPPEPAGSSPFSDAGS